MCKRIDGVYLIKNCVTGMVRVGSAKDINKRFSNYRAKLRGGTGNKLMQDDFNMFGECSFEFIILEECNVGELFKREQYWLKEYSDCCMYNKNRVIKTEKKIRRGKQASNYKKERSEITKGENNGNCRLKTDEVIEIKMMLQEGIKQDIIADKFGVSTGFISAINCGKRWQSIEI